MTSYLSIGTSIRQESCQSLGRIFLILITLLVRPITPQRACLGRALGHVPAHVPHALQAHRLDRRTWTRRPTIRLRQNSPARFRCLHYPPFLTYRKTPFHVRTPLPRSFLDPPRASTDPQATTLPCDPPQREITGKTTQNSGRRSAATATPPSLPRPVPEFAATHITMTSVRYCCTASRFDIMHIIRKRDPNHLIIKGSLDQQN